MNRSLSFGSLSFGCQIALAVLMFHLSPFPAHAATISIQPDSQDTFVSADAATFNGATVSSLYPGVLPVDTVAAGPGNTNSLVQFSLSTLAGITSGQVTSAYLDLTSTAFTAFGTNPTSANPVVLDVYGATSSWSPGTVFGSDGTNWNNQPGITGLVGQVTVNNNSGVFAVDVTSLLKSWLDNPATNNGFVLKQDAPVNGGSVYAAFLNSSGGSGGPLLQVNAVPEPSSIVLIGLGTALAFVVERRRRRVLTQPVI